jgi:glycyl-tRNA synthetase (class II)
MKAFKLLLCLFLGGHTFSCFGASVYYTLHVNEESYRFFESLKNKHLEYEDSEIDFEYIEESKFWYNSNAGIAIRGHFLDLIDHYFYHNDRDHKDCYQMAFWLVHLYENKIPVSEVCVQKINNFLNLFEQELGTLCPDLQYVDVEEAINGITFQPIQSQLSKGSAKQISKRKQCLLL